MPLPRHVALGIAGHAGAADIGPNSVNPATNGNANLARQRRAAVAVAAHSRLPLVDEFLRDQGERRVVLDAEARPVRRIAAAGTAALAEAFGIKGGLGPIHPVRLTRKPGAGQPASNYQGSLGCSQTRLCRHFARSTSRLSGYFSSR